MVKTGGYQIYSTVNPDVQAAVDQVYEDLSSLPATASSQQLQSGIVIVDNTTGDIVALAGGVGKSREASSGTVRREASCLRVPSSNLLQSTHPPLNSV